MGRKANLELGDILLIPVEGGEYYNLSKIIYLSKHFKKVMAIGVYNRFVNNEIIPTELNEPFHSILYTSIEGLKNGRWKIIGNIPLRENDIGLTKRLVGDEIWIEDSYIGRATPDDFMVLPKFSVLGLNLVEKKIKEVYRNNSL